jgi:hypothetical protein
MRSTLRPLATAVAASVCLLALSTPASGQISKTSNAVKNLKTQGQTVVAETRLGLKNAKNVLGLKLKGFKTAVLGGNFANLDLQQFFEDIEAVQGDAAIALHEGVVEMRQIASQLLFDLAAAKGEGDGFQLPENFFRGDQGHLDVFLFNMREVARKSQRLMRHRLRSLARNLRKNTPVNVTSVVGPGFPLPTLVVGEVPLEVTPFEIYLSVDLLMAFSSQDVLEDGTLCASGSADADKGDVNVQVFDVSGALVVEQVSVLNPLKKRWSVCFEDIPEGNYTVNAIQAGFSAHNEIGIR